MGVTPIQFSLNAPLLTITPCLDSCRIIDFSSDSRSTLGQFTNLLEALIVTLSVESIEFRGVSSASLSADFYSDLPSTLQHLYLTDIEAENRINFDTLADLRNLSLPLTNLSKLTLILPDLVYLNTMNSPLADRTQIQNAQSLQTLITSSPVIPGPGQNCDTPGAWAGLVKLPESLKTLHLVHRYNCALSFAAVNRSGQFANLLLENLVLRALGTNLVAITPPSSLRTASFDLSGFESFPDFRMSPNLTSLALFGGVGYPYHLTNLSQLSNLEIRGMSWNSGYSDNICQFLPSSRVKTLTWLNNSPSMDLARCIEQFTSLEHLTVNISKDTFDASKLPSTITHITLQIHEFNARYAQISDFNFANFIQGLPRIEHLNLFCLFATGAFPSEDLMRATTLKELRLTENGLSGSLTPHFLAALPNLRVLNLYNNDLSGTIPWFGYGSEIQELILAGNRFDSWPPLNLSFISRFASSAHLPPKLHTVDLTDNLITVIPGDAQFEALTNLKYFNISFNPITGRIPSLFKRSSAIVSFRASNCNFFGSFPDALNRPLLSGGLPDSFIAASQIKEIHLHRNQLCGNAPGLGSNNALDWPNLVDLNLQHNHLAGTLPTSWSEVTFSSLSLQNNAFSSAPHLPTYVHPFLSTKLDFSSNPLTGSVFDMFGFNGSIDLRNTSFEVCNGFSNIGASVQCFLPVSTCMCQASWPCNRGEEPCLKRIHSARDTLQGETNNQTCVTPGPRPSVPPAIPPYTYPDPISPNFTCPFPPPSSSFICNNGTWTSNSSSVSDTVIFIPPSYHVVIAGNFTGKSITIMGFNASLTLDGCLLPNGTRIRIVIQVSPEEMEGLVLAKKLNRTILTTSPACEGASDVSKVELVVDQKKKDCKRVEVSNAGSGSGKLVATFTIDKSRCNIWWIVLASVLGGIVLLILIVVLAVTFSPTLKRKVRPFWVRSHKRDDARVA